MGTRVLRIDLGGLVALWRWPFNDPDAALRIIDKRLPPDARFVRVLRVEGPKVYIVVASRSYAGDLETQSRPIPSGGRDASIGSAPAMTSRSRSRCGRRPGGFMLACAT